MTAPVLKDIYSVDMNIIAHPENGRPIAYGSPDDIRNNPDVIKAYLGEA